MQYFGDIVEKNGKTIRENNTEIPHNIPIGTIVEFDINPDQPLHGTIDENGKEWSTGIMCGKARAYIYDHTRDCDGTPLYTLSFKNPDKIRPDEKRICTIIEGWEERPFALKRDISFSIFYGLISGYDESSLRIIK